MAGINENKGPGWGDHNTPYGTIHSYTDPGTHSTPGKGGSAHTNNWYGGEDAPPSITKGYSQ